MAYKLRTVRGDLFTSNCTLNSTADSASWLGLDKDGVLPGYISGEVGITVAVCIYAIVRTRQDLHFSAFGSTRPPAGQIFQDISVEAAEGSACKLAQFILNYGFQTLGLEISFATSVIVVVSRQDGMALLYACLLGAMLMLAAHGRRTCARVWPFYLVLLVILLPAQYLATVGLPPLLCSPYPWNISDLALQKWLFLPSNDIGPYSRPDASLLLGDFFQLLMVSLQMQVFSRELLHVRHSVTSPAAEAETGSCSAVAAAFDGEQHDFVDSIRNVVDVLKNVVFVYWFLGTLIIMFVTGTVNINLFCFGYVATSFYFMWFGDDFLQKKKAVRLRSWHLAMSYNFAVILVKLVMQLVGCALRDRILPLDCVVVQLLSITCLSPVLGAAAAFGSCTVPVPQSAASFTWDVVCFIALLIQRRIFLSRYFILTVIEIKTQNKLASSGARLINQLLASRRKKRKEEEEKNLEALQRKVERIQLRQLRLQQGTTHEFDEHYKVIRSGGAYMFEGDSDDDELTSTTDGNTIATDDPADSGDYLNVGVDPLSLMTIAVSQGVKISLATAERAQQHQQQLQHHDGAADGTSSDSFQPLVTVDKEIAHRRPSDPAAEAPLDQLPASAAGQADEALNDLNYVNIIVKDGSWETTKDVARLSKTLCESMADYITVKLLSISKDYRIVARQMHQERKKVKTDIKKNFNRPPGQAMSAAASQPLVDLESSISRDGCVVSSGTPHDSADSDPHPDPSSPTRLEQEITAEDGLLEESVRSGGPPDGGVVDLNLAHSSRLYRLISVFCVAIISRTEFLCYFAMILSHLCSGSVLTMPLPVVAFLWGQLSIPRPAKTFWVFVITYVMVTVLIKYVSQFSFNTWNDSLTVDVFQPARIIGLMKASNYAVFDIVVLVCLFLHRSALQKYGLWKNASELKFDLARAKSTVRSWQPVSSSDSSGAGAASSAASGATLALPLVQFAVLEAAAGSGSSHSGGATVAHSSGTGGAGRDASPSEAATKEPPVGKEMDADPVGIKARLSAWANGLVGRDHNASFDVYPYIFFCDFVNFIIVVFFYWSFGPTAGNVTSYLRDNRIPWPFLIQLLLQFVLIVVDRALYLRRNAFGKFVFQVVLVIVVHLWMFFLLPWITQLPFTSNKPAQIWYFIKCIYFWLSAYQIRAGYPMNTIAGSFFRKHNYLSWTLLGLARAVPFLLEMRISMDWIWTESSLALGHWFTMEDVYINVFSMKCLRDMELKYPTPRGRNRGAGSKYAWGGFVLFGLAFIVWFPLLLFSFANAVYTPNAPVECSFTLTVGSYQPLFTAIAQGDGVASVTRNDYYSLLKETFRNTKDASSFLENYDERDVRVITFRGDSTAVWAISPPDRETLQAEVCANVSLSITVHITLTRASADNLVARIIKGEFSQSLEPMSPVRQQLCDLIKSSSASSNTVVITKLFPRFITVPATGTPSASPLNLPYGLVPYSNVTLTLNSTTASPSCPCNSNWWWKVQENTTYPQLLNATGYEPAVVQDLSIVTFSNRVAPIGFSFLTGYGVIGLYVSIVFVIGRFLRIFTSGHLRTIMFDELPNVDKILKLCNNIYFARQLKRFRLEEDLFAKLIFLYRSPDLLMRWTKVKVT